MLKELVKRTPVVREVALWLMRNTSDLRRGGFSSADYWDERYRSGGDSGAGSYNRLAIFKANFLNDFVEKHEVRSVIEFGCGDGAQLQLAKYPRYIGIDISRIILEKSRARFASDSSKSFVHLDESANQSAELALSLDVIYHLTEDEIFNAHMECLFRSAERFVIIYASNDDRKSDAPHVRHRRFTDWVSANTNATLIETIANPYPYDPARMDDTSFADFYVFSV